MKAFVAVALCVLSLSAVQGQVINATYYFAPKAATSLDAKCQGSDWSTFDYSSSFASTYTGNTKGCARKYINVCIGPDGLEACNTYYGMCRDVQYDWTDKQLYPNVVTTVKPQKCVLAGALMVPDAQVLIIAQVIFGIIFLTLSFILCWNLRTVKGWGFWVVIAQLCMSLILIFSYFYLNGIIQLAGSLAALALYKTRKPVLIGVGILFCLVTFFWVTYQHGLGDIQHFRRLTAGDAMTNTFEELCNNYYRGYFRNNIPLNALTANPEDTSYGFCTRNWLAAELFFQMFAELLLVALTFCGVQVLLFEEPAKSTSDSAPYQ